MAERFTTTKDAALAVFMQVFCLQPDDAFFAGDLINSKVPATEAQKRRLGILLETWGLPPLVEGSHD